MLSRFVLLLAFLSVLSRTTPLQAQTPKLWVFVGTYTDAKSKGIYRLELDPATGKLDHLQLVAETPSPSFLAIHPSGKLLYAVNELDKLDGKKGGGVSAFDLDPKTGALKYLNRQPSQGAHPCHLVVDPSGKYVLAANYTGGSVIVLPIEKDGSLGEASDFVQHQGSSVNKNRQEAPHAHSINLDKAGRFAFAADLGLDKVLVYRFDAKSGKLTPNDPPAAAVDPGAGPRHFAFHPSGKQAYVINELTCTVTAFDYDAGKGVLTPRQTIPTLAQRTKGDSTAEVVVHPSGKFLYGSNRGHNSIAMFAIKDDGELSFIGHQQETIKTPRNFSIDPSGKYLLVANQSGHTISVFRIDPNRGTLKLIGDPVAVPSPVCIRFLEKPA
jgi:6-phosphogluconolactonase